uniref:Uncharacterized protein n=1 Tax=Rhizophora mucronata TaxID=61149 RepID=A0A2P2QFG0_RHIMU
MQLLHQVQCPHQGKKNKKKETKKSEPQTPKERRAANTSFYRLRTKFTATSSIFTVHLV